MTITIHTWHIIVLLFFIPIIYASFRKEGGLFDLYLDVICTTLFCWGVDIGLIIGLIIDWFEG